MRFIEGILDAGCSHPVAFIIMILSFVIFISLILTIVEEKYDVEIFDDDDDDDDFLAILNLITLSNIINYNSKKH